VSADKILLDFAEAFLPCKPKLGVIKRLAKLKISILVYRRNRGDAILAHKLMRASSLSALFSTVGPKPFKQSTLSRVCTQFFSSRIINS
jgi:hypothetical protein